MAPIDLRWLCAPLLFISTLATAQDDPSLPPVFTSYVVPYDSLISTPRGDGACVAGFIEATCITGGANSCLSYKENEGDDFYSMRVRSTGYYCGEWEGGNNQLLESPEPVGHTDSKLDSIESLLSSLGETIVRAQTDAALVTMSWTNTPSILHGHFTDLNSNVNSALGQLRRLSELTVDGVADLRDYTAYVDSYYESISAANDVAFDTNLKIDSLTSNIGAEIARLDSVAQGLAAAISEIELDIENPDVDIQDILDSIESLESSYEGLGGGLSYAFQTINNVQSQIYESVGGLRTDTYDRFSGVYSYLSTMQGSIYSYIDDEISGVSASGADVLVDAQSYTDSEISALSSAIDAGNADIASSIDFQAGNIISAIDGQGSAITGAIDGQSSIISDGFDDLTDFLGDGEPSASDLASQDSELSGLVSDYDYFVDYDINIGEAVCPAPYQLDLSITGKSVYVSFEPICEASVLVKPLLIAASSVAFALIVMGVRRA